MLQKAFAVCLALLCLDAAAQLPAVATRNGLPTLAPVIERVAPAVVNIAVLVRSPEEQNPLLRDPFFRRFFGLQAPQPQLSAGSGVIVDAKNGYVITNHHVIRDASEVAVTLKDNRRFPARLVGSDAGTDIALLRIGAENLAEAKFGDSDALAVGDFVVAIGNPFGIGQTVTSGIVSALGRSGLSPEGYEDFIQTDAAINPGNSGGALINLRGELIGINSAILGPAGGNVGIGFAVPANMARAVMQQIARFGEVRRGRLGIQMQDLPGRDGAAIAQIQPDSPAAKAGLRTGDIVTAVNGRPVRGAAELRAQLGVIPVGESVEMRVQRGAEQRSIRARIGELEARSAGGGETLAQLAGASLRNAERAGVRGKERVVLVAAVEAGTPAFQAGLRPGDLIIAVNRSRVTSIAALGKALTGSEAAALNVVRGDFLLTIPLR
ncbi:MAG: Do family serine endopeptidase [Betaproteobacteria bacterium]|nr:MAG: Do family serine endopeptidase [Betaproteobacteria bacterium]